jgi:polyisoprenoid-binding protein YceI
MSATDTTTLAGTWQLDPIHSSAGFAVKYMAVTTFRSEFKDVAATLEAGDDGSAKLTGTVQVASIDIDNPDFKGHLMADDFFGVATNPTIEFVSSSFAPAGDSVVIAGDLTINGVTQAVEAQGELSGPTEDAMGNSRVAIAVETKVDRTAFGLNWNAPLPKGGNALANEVKLTLDLAFVKQA